MDPSLPVAWAIPFLGVLLSIALLPMLGRLWHRHMAWVMGAWIAALLVPWAAMWGAPAAGRLARHAILVEYLPFMTLLLALYTAAGGILLRGLIAGTPGGNTGLLAAGTLLAGVMGTTGAAMVLIHPLLHANAHRRRKLHLVVFFTILVANAGGALSPLGDPPLYLGYLRGVPFFWPLRHLGPPLGVLAALMLALFYADRSRAGARRTRRAERERLRVRGWHNVALIAVVIAATLLQARIRRDAGCRGRGDPDRAGGGGPGRSSA